MQTRQSDDFAGVLDGRRLFCASSLERNSHAGYVLYRGSEATGGDALAYIAVPQEPAITFANRLLEWLFASKQLRLHTEAEYV
jgi:hypothetical protein